MRVCTSTNTEQRSTVTSGSDQRVGQFTLLPYRSGCVARIHVIGGYTRYWEYEEVVHFEVYPLPLGRWERLRYLVYCGTAWAFHFII